MRLPSDRSERRGSANRRSFLPPPQFSMQFTTQSAFASRRFRRRRTGYARRFWLSVILANATEARVADDAIRCDACPVLCYIKPGRTGSCDRYANDNGQLIRIDPHVVLDRALSRGDSLVPFLDRDREWDGSLVTGPE